MTNPSLLRRIVVALFGLALLAAGCGDDGDGDSGADPAPDSSDGGESAPAAEPEADPPPGDVGAVVTIGDLTYELSEENTCISNESGGMSSQFSDGPDITADFNLPPLDWETSSTQWEPPGVGLRDRSGEGRRSFSSTVRLADTYPGTDAEQATVTEWEFGDGWARGTGQMIDTQALVNAEADGTAPPALVPFTFEVVCEP